MRTRLSAELSNTLVSITMDHEDDLGNAAAAEERLGVTLGCNFPSVPLMATMQGELKVGGGVGVGSVGGEGHGGTHCRHAGGSQAKVGG